MGKYYFNVHNVVPHPDDIGEELPDDAAAWHEATIIAGELFKDIDGNFQPGKDGVSSLPTSSGDRSISSSSARGK